MADYYTQFSVTVDRLTPEEAAWMKHALEGDGTEAEVTDKDGWPSFEWSFHADDGEGTHLWIRSEESGSTNDVAEFMQTFLKRFRPNDVFSMEASFSCSRPCTDGYGGAAVFVTANGMTGMNTGAWLDKQRKLYEARRRGWLLKAKHVGVHSAKAQTRGRGKARNGRKAGEVSGRSAAGRP